MDDRRYIISPYHIASMGVTSQYPITTASNGFIYFTIEGITIKKKNSGGTHIPYKNEFEPLKKDERNDLKTLDEIENIINEYDDVETITLHLKIDKEDIEKRKSNISIDAELIKKRITSHIIKDEKKKPTINIEVK